MKFKVLFLLLVTTIVVTTGQASDYQPNSKGHSSVKMQIVENGSDSVELDSDNEKSSVIPKLNNEEVENVDTQGNKDSQLPKTGQEDKRNLISIGFIILMIGSSLFKRSKLIGSE